MQDVSGISFHVDIRLPGMGGVELLAPLKAMQPHMLLVMVTAHAPLETAVQALNEGASGYITKPLNVDGVLGTVSEDIENKRLLTENSRLLQEVQL